MSATPVEPSQSGGDQFEIVGYGVDDVTFGFDMTGSRSLTRLNETPGLATRRGKISG
jgi:hypothetical protein